jgi:hypothetical protein
VTTLCSASSTGTATIFTSIERERERERERHDGSARATRRPFELTRPNAIVFYTPRRRYGHLDAVEASKDLDRSVEARPVEERGGLTAATDLKFVEDAVDVILDGGEANTQPYRDVFVGKPVTD